MQQNENHQVQLFHDMLFGNIQKSMKARSELITNYNFKHSQLQHYRPSGMYDGVYGPSADKTFVLRETTEGLWYNPKPIVKKSMPVLESLDRPLADNTYVRKNIVTDYVNEKWMPLSSLGLNVVSVGSSLHLEIKGYDTFKNAVKNGQFVANWKGRKVWKTGFRGNAHVPGHVVAAEKAKFPGRFKTLRLVKIGGAASAFLGIGLSVKETINKKWSSEANTKLVLDLIMTGVAFLPGPGWIISGIYFLSDTALGLSGIDWWHEVWENLILPTRESLKHAMTEYSKTRRLTYIP